MVNASTQRVQVSRLAPGDVIDHKGRARTIAFLSHMEDSVNGYVEVVFEYREGCAPTWITTLNSFARRYDY